MTTQGFASRFRLAYQSCRSCRLDQGDDRRPPPRHPPNRHPLVGGPRVGGPRVGVVPIVWISLGSARFLDGWVGERPRFRSLLHLAISTTKGETSHDRPTHDPRTCRRSRIPEPIAAPHAYRARW